MKRDTRQILTELLVLRAQGRDERAFADLHALWQADVQRMARVSVGESEGGAEVAQDVWIAAARNLKSLQDPACFPRWLFQIVRRRGADWVRRRQRERNARQSIANHALDKARSLAPHRPAHPLAEAIERLDQSERELLTLYYEVGRSVPEIAEILQLPGGTVKSRLHSLREHLRENIETEHT